MHDLSMTLFTEFRHFFSLELTASYSQTRIMSQVITKNENLSQKNFISNLTNFFQQDYLFISVDCSNYTIFLAHNKLLTFESK